MGVITLITLDEVNILFDTYNFTNLIATTSGIIDTTYIVNTKDNSYILKKYERNIKTKINLDILLLKELKSAGLNVPICLEEQDGWYLYEKLKGKQPKNIKSYHIQAIARLLAKIHQRTKNIPCTTNMIQEQEVLDSLKYTKEHYFAYYKKFEFLKKFSLKSDSIIHGDIFKDNTVFDGKKVGVFDFIDSSCGTFAFDVAVTLVGFDVKLTNHYFINLFLNNYNQHAPKKLNKKRVLYKMKVASHYYALKRVNKYKNTFRAKELL